MDGGLCHRVHAAAADVQKLYAHDDKVKATDVLQRLSGSVDDLWRNLRGQHDTNPQTDKSDEYKAFTERMMKEYSKIAVRYECSKTDLSVEEEGLLWQKAATRGAVQAAMAAAAAGREFLEREKAANWNARLLLQELEEEKNTLEGKKRRTKKKKRPRVFATGASDAGGVTATEPEEMCAMGSVLQLESVPCVAPVAVVEKDDAATENQDSDVVTELMRECSLCMSEDKNHAFVPCGHVCVCQACAGKCLMFTK